MTASDFRAHRPTVTGTRHMVAAGHYLAAHVGFLVLEAGGNAVDAGVATGITEGVVESHFHAFSGVSPILVYRAEAGVVATVDGVGTWPRAASCQYFHDRFAGKIPQGAQSAIVPAPPDAWITALRHWGTMSFGELAARAIAFARDGFPMYPHLAMLIEDRIDLIREWPGNSAVYLPDGRVPAVGALFRQPALAATLQHMADEEGAAAAKGGRDAGLRAARDAFYKGDIAHAFAAYIKEHDGLLTYDDMAGYEATVEPAVKGRYRDFEIFTAAGRGPVRRCCCKRWVSSTASTCKAWVTTRLPTSTPSSRRSRSPPPTATVTTAIPASWTYRSTRCCRPVTPPNAAA